ncbi:DNA topoisomerase IB [Asanoa sp. WMMD1127]|uniref:DNA topoisomerase IB n=1 Tax=Asanoa sp. WMMD1127 TaxID=3016107 RepID=UPI002416D5D0|nr:DNA topoisomerase IB [Asanoa sp. WMMD1127]MDG4824836.1 DNA topoisomerase IB [Asanoa sp. WMMD1127]
MRLRRSDTTKPGYGRRRQGKGFRYLRPDGRPLTDRSELDRIRALVIPPAWQDVWISTDPRGHIQATGTDAAGRRQYRYHDAWRAKRDAAKFDHVLEVGGHLPEIRSTVDKHLTERGPTRNRVLAAAVRLLDVGCFRIGGEEYANGDDASFGLATVRREHVTLAKGVVRFCYPAKGGLQRTLDVRDDDVRAVVRSLLGRPGDQPELLAYRDGRAWVDVRSADVNAYLREISGVEVTAKDFRTWNGTVLAAVALAVDEAGARGRRSRAARKRAVPAAIREVADYLGNTPAVARSSYVDPRVVDLFQDGTTIAAALDGGPPDLDDRAVRDRIEAAVLSLLRTD